MNCCYILCFCDLRLVWFLLDFVLAEMSFAFFVFLNGKRGVFVQLVLYLGLQVLVNGLFILEKHLELQDLFTRLLFIVGFLLLFIVGFLLLLVVGGLLLLVVDGLVVFLLFECQLILHDVEYLFLILKSLFKVSNFLVCSDNVSIDVENEEVGLVEEWSMCF